MPDEEIDYDSPLPPYRQIAAVIIGEIERGELRPNRPIPSEATMIQRWGVARDTVRRAVRYLRDEGYAYTVAQRGTFVAENGH
ncbi:winged helix-turn-helix domain-containing protein [Streptomonospora salina]|uniref:DNA-binding GntR family transcriptional regulator n=1 Tax=Streptomonospora salina TaxID=104205 RepID=A0A841EDM4_9ACTN|nr:winged helix-turn-helix domain-containing protein [Streptomonospora salina]MBB5999439.1 DNA-binding GntR family transcriptional regulator [Streptomonospora salina]